MAPVKIMTTCLYETDRQTDSDVHLKISLLLKHSAPKLLLFDISGQSGITD